MKELQKEMAAMEIKSEVKLNEKVQDKKERDDDGDYIRVVE